ncbi:MAG: glutamine--fructose-6-phosphate transaminase (isomerizing) [Alphaproteobacteria bacterium]|nr:glutamine--fructose-6-phosphate transaminase (isomerizing) [Alphaproteobacteria bacterium]
MCGIVGYIGTDLAFPFVLKGLKRLEYRGYDSSGMAFLNKNQIDITKSVGKISQLEDLMLSKTHTSKIGIGHTRWATHGEPSDRNAHPFYSNSKKLAIIHNGIIENYAIIKKELQNKGFQFESDTDTEVLINFIENIQQENQVSLEKSLRIALQKIRGAYCILIISVDHPDTIFAARKGSPLVIGIGNNTHYIASDASPIVEFTKEVIYVNDYQIAIIKSDELILKNLGNETITPQITKLDLEITSIDKGIYDDFMLKEIEEQPFTVFDCLRGRLDFKNCNIKLSGVEEFEQQFKQTQKITIIACGTSWHAGIYGKYIIETFCRIPVEVDYASEYRYRNPIIKKGDILIPISQSGETADTLTAIEAAKKDGALIFGIINVAGSSIARICHAGIYTHSGVEIGVASTKAYTGQLTALVLFTLKLALIKESISKQQILEVIDHLQILPTQIQKIIDQKDQLKSMAEKIYAAPNMLYLGRGFNFPTALEGALKMKEVTYIHAEGYPAAEMKHGPIALVNENLPVVFIAPKDNYLEKLYSNIQEINARKGKIIIIANEQDTNALQYTNEVFYIPNSHEILNPILSIIPLQLLSYFVGKLKHLDVDKPRNLAKSVTVE